MPSSAEVRAYALGLRWQQAFVFAVPTRQCPIVHRAFLRLDNAITALTLESIPSSVIERMRTLEQNSLRRIEEARSVRDAETLAVICQYCRDDLEMANSDFLHWASSQTASRSSLTEWYDLGKEIASGEGGDSRLPIPNPPPRRPWAWDRPKIVRELLRCLKVNRALLFPQRKSNASWLEDLPLHLDEWARVEFGLETLYARTTTDVQPQARIEIADARLSPNQRSIVQVITAAGVRLTTVKVLERLEREHPDVSTGMTKQSLATLVKLKILDKDPDAEPPGYGLPSWRLPR